jgi:hypothetical protein
MGAPLMYQQVANANPPGGGPIAPGPTDLEPMGEINEDDPGWERFLDALYDGARDDIGGAFEGLGSLFTDPVETFTGAWDAIRDDPWGLLFSQELRDAWNRGDWPAFFGRGLWDGGSLVAGGSGAIAKFLRALGRGADADRPSSSGNGDDSGDQDNGTGTDPDKPPDRNESCPPGNSFAPGTPVLLADGTTAPIEDVAVGDAVLAFDPLTGEEGPREVTATITGQGAKTLVDLDLDLGVTGTDGTTATLTATDEHPFWVPDRAAWVDAIDLAPGTWLRTSAGTWAQVTAVDVRETDAQRVHNLTIADLHTYYVAPAGAAVLVHNSGGESGDQLQPGECASNGQRRVPDDSHLPEASELIAEGQEWQTPPGSRRGRARNNMPMQGGPPSTTVYKRNPATGDVSNYIVYDANGNAIKRVDLEGAAHGGVPTPHVVYYEHNSPRPGVVFVKEQRMVRPARPDEIP